MSNPCTHIIAREYWLEGRLISPCVVLYMLFSNKDKLRASYNDEECIWEVVGTREALDFDAEDATYPYVNHTPANVTDLGEILSYEVRIRLSLVVKFADGVVVSLRYDTNTDSEILDVKYA